MVAGENKVSFVSRPKAPVFTDGLWRLDWFLLYRVVPKLLLVVPTLP
jgi:hypothetical protein